MSYSVFPNVLHSCFAIDNGGFIIVHPDYIKGSAPSAAEHIMFKEPAIATELVKNGIMYNDSCVDIINIDLQFFWKVWAVISLHSTTNAYYALAHVRARAVGIGGRRLLT